MPPKKENPGSGGGGGGKGGPKKNDTTSPSLDSPTTYAIDENTVLVAVLTASEPVTWSLSGNDANLFTINSEGGLTFNAPPNFEDPVDEGLNNVYNLTVTLTDRAGNVSTENLTVTVTDVAEDTTPPIITGPTALDFAENQMTVPELDFDTDDPEATWSISGDDAARFTIDPETGELTFNSAPNYEAPSDSGDDNVYNVTVVATDPAGNAATRDVAITVTDVEEDITPPSIDGPSAISLSENQTSVAEFLSDDETASWTLDGIDAALFTIDANGSIAFKVAPDFEAPADSNGDNVYSITVEASDPAGNTANQNLSVTVLNVLQDSDPSTFMGPSSFTIDENSTSVETLQASRDVTWSIIGGADSAFFTIDLETGALAFTAPPDFETPLDTDGDNSYDVIVEFADNDGFVDTQALVVTIVDVAENPSPTPYSSVVVFGDSLSDNGNFAALAADFLKPGYNVPFQYDGGDGSIRTYDTLAFTDGTAYADTLAGLLSLDASYANYAFGGAEALGSKTGAGYINEYSNLTYTDIDKLSDTFSIVENTNDALTAYGSFDINLGAQVNRYLSPEWNPDGVQADTIAVINIGANDLGSFDASFWNIIFGGVNRFAADLGSEIEAQARRLADHGVAGIALYTLPVAEFFIGYEDLNWLEAPAARDLLDSVNDDILYRARLLNADEITTEVVRLDIMSEELLADMQTHGFLYKGPYLFGYSGDPIWVETSEGVIEPTFLVNEAATAYRAEQILFFDEIHPSGALHDILAVFSSESISTDEVFGSSGGDTLTMTGADDFVVARGGSDTVNLAGGDDVALGGNGNDTLRGDDGSDLLIGGAGSDSLEGGSGSDLLAGSVGDDDLSGGSEADILIGGLGNDMVFGDAGDDVFLFFEEALWGGAGGSADLYDGGEGENDMLFIFMASEFYSVDGADQHATEATTTISAGNAGVSTTLMFGDGSAVTASNIESITLHMGLPEESGSPLEALDLSGDLLARYDEAELWGIV